MKNNLFFYIIFAVLVILLFFSCIYKKKIQTGQTEQFFIEKKSKNKIGYLLYLPHDYFKNKQNKYPLIIFLHGAGNQGSYLGLVKRLPLPKMLDQKKDFPFIVISPQYELSKEYVLENGLSIENFQEFYNHIINKYKIDINRVYLTGLSFGGYLTWNIAINYPDKFAAIAPICGFGVLENLYKYADLPKNLNKIKNIPIWVFHGAKDSMVPIKQSEIIVNELKKYRSNVKFTIYPDLDHDCWTKTYNNQELYDWFLENIK